MGKIKTDIKIIEKIVNLRRKGLSISEISNKTGKSKSVVSRYIQGVVVLPKYVYVLKRKQGGSKVRSEDLWIKSSVSASRLIKKIKDRDKIMLLIGIYWGEGTKKELNIINGDPILLLSFVEFIKELGVSRDRIKASVRVYDNINKEKAISYWSKILKIDKNNFFNTEVVKSNKNNKFEFGMCRLRVEKSSKEFKMLMSLISNIKSQIMLL